MQNFPIKVDLSNFFNDERRCSMVLVDVSWANVKNLQDHIQKLFYLKDISLLTDEGCFLPPKESIIVVKPTQSLKAFQLKSTSTSSNSELEDEPRSTASNKKRKTRSPESENGPPSSTPNLPKRSKLKLSSSTRKEVTFGEPSPAMDSTNDLGREPINTKSTIQYGLQLQNISCINSDNKQTLNNTSSFKNQSCSSNHIIFKDVLTEVTLVEKCQHSLTPPPEVEFRSQLMELDLNVVRIFKLPRKPEPIQILEEILIPAKVIKSPVAKAPEKQPETPLQESKTIESFAADISQNIITPVVSSELPADNPNRTAEEITEAGDKSASKELKEVPSNPPAELTTGDVSREDDCSTLRENSVAEDASHSLLETDSEDDIMVLDDTNAEDSDSDVQPVSLKDESIDIIADMLQSAAPLQNLPNVGDTIIFKVTKAKGASLSAPCTDYIAGSCTYINRRTKCLTISVIAFPSAASLVLQQYSSGLDDSSTAVPLINIGFNNLIDAKIVVTSVD